MGTYTHNYKSTYNLLRGLRWLIRAVILGVVSTLNLQGLSRVGTPDRKP